MSATSRLIVLFLTLVVSQVSQAGAGYYFYLTNNMSQGWFGNSDKTYPRVTVHVAGGSTCWYLNSIADWNQYAVPGDSEKPLYTEAKDTVTGCFFETSSVEIAMYVQADANSSWVQIGDKAKLWNELNAENGFYINPGLPYTLPLTSLCGLSIQNTFLPGTNLNQVKVSGTPKLDGCPDTHTTTASVQSQATVNAAGVNPLSPPVGEKTFNLKVGQTKRIRLPELDPSSVWELDGGTCQGDHAIKSDLKANYSKRRVLPQTVNVTGTAAGQRICSITAYHYPERTVVTQGKIIFNVK
jgi:hypothetical protein